MNYFLSAFCAMFKFYRIIIVETASVSTGAEADITEKQPDVNTGEQTDDKESSFEGDGLPNANETSVEYIFDDDDGVYTPDDAETITYSGNSDNESIKTEPDTSILYQNQEADPKLQGLLFNYYNNL